MNEVELNENLYIYQRCWMLNVKIWIFISSMEMEDVVVKEKLNEL